HLAGPVRAGDERQRLLAVVEAADGEQVAVVEGGGAHLEQHLSRPRPRLRPLRRQEVLEPEAVLDGEDLQAPSSAAPSAARAAVIFATSSRASAASSLPAGQPIPRPWLPCLGMMWKWTCITTWWAAAPLFCSTL